MHGETVKKKFWQYISVPYKQYCIISQKADYCSLSETWLYEDYTI